MSRRVRKGKLNFQCVSSDFHHNIKVDFDHADNVLVDEIRVDVERATERATKWEVQRFIWNSIYEDDLAFDPKTYYFRVWG